MVLKPAELTPLTTLLLADILVEAGLPAGVLNVVTTTNPSTVVTEWMDSGVARKVSFTGSTEVGKTLLRQAAGTVMRTSMELGGNAPFIVCADADIARAVDGLMLAKMRNTGQACTAANRVFVHRSVIDEFTEAFTAKMAALKVGDGAAEGTQVGPLVEPKAVAKVSSLVDDAVSKGATVACGGQAIEGPGYFYPPTVLTGGRTRRRPGAQRDLRPGRGDHPVRRRRQSPRPGRGRRGDLTRQRYRVGGPRRVLLQPGRRPLRSAVGCARSRYGRG